MNNLLILWNYYYLISLIISCKKSWIIENLNIINWVIYYIKNFSLEIDNNWIDLWDLIMNFSLINHYLNIIKEILKYFIIWFIFENSLRNNIIRIFSIFILILVIFKFLTFFIIKIQEYKYKNLKLNFYFIIFFILLFYIFLIFLILNY